MNKPKTKKVKKWKNTRINLISSIEKIEKSCISQRTLDLVLKFKKKLLATQPQPIKEEIRDKDCNHIFWETRYGRICCLCGISKEEWRGNHKLWSKPNTNSKEIEFEEIKEETDYKGQKCWQSSIEETINKLIRNQNKLISLNKRNIK